MPPLLTGGRACVITRNEPAQKPEPEAKPKPTSLLLENPVRSGQSIIFMEGDVTVLGSVGSGAEIIAGGSIHVYGDAARPRDGGRRTAIRARASSASKIEAELLAIDGFYHDCRGDRSGTPQPAGAGLAGRGRDEDHRIELRLRR